MSPMQSGNNDGTRQYATDSGVAQTVAACLVHSFARGAEIAAIAMTVPIAAIATARAYIDREIRSAEMQLPARNGLQLKLAADSLGVGDRGGRQCGHRYDRCGCKAFGCICEHLEIPFGLQFPLARLKPPTQKHDALEPAPNLMFIRHSCCGRPVAGANALDADQGNRNGIGAGSGPDHTVCSIPAGGTNLKTATGATPLSSLDAVSLDTETTGMEPSDARILQLGLVHLTNGKQVAESVWEQLVHPNIAIPEPAIRVHGIDEARIVDAPTLPEIWPEFIDRLGSRVVIGHTIGFDLAVIEAEAARHGLSWTKPRALCVRMLAMLVAPRLADHSLDALAGWLELPVENRHQALGDALTAAALFRALLPKLKDAGIGTLAEAERASLRLASEVERHRSAGWSLPVEQPAAPTTAGRVDSYAYRHLVGDIMSTPVVVENGATLRQAMQEMTRLGVSSVFTAESPESALPLDRYGILTERDVMRRLSADGADAFELRIGELATQPVVTIRQSAFIYRAAGRMARMKIRHLGVRDDHDRLVGAVSARDLLRARTSPAIMLDDTIEHARSPAELAAAWATLPAIVGDLQQDGVDAPVVCRIVSEEIRAITRRAAMLAETAMKEDDRGPPPCPYVVLILGSGGRGESMLVPDQDNAIIFRAGNPDSAQDRWFARMGEHMSAELDAAGIPYCKGGVMAMNPDWRGSVVTWRERVDDWVGRSNPADLLNVDIFFDAYPVHGENGLFHDSMSYAFARAHENALFAKLLGESIASVSSPFTLFGGIRAKGNRLDLKTHVLFPITAAARTLAIRHNIPSQSTRERLEGLLSLGIGNQDEFNGLLAAQQLAFELVLENQSRDIETGRKPGNSIDLSRLDRGRRTRLKRALGNVESIPEIVRTLMFSAPLGSGDPAPKD